MTTGSPSAESDVLVYSSAAEHFSEFVFTEPQVNKRGGRAVYVYRSETQRQPPRVQLCLDGEPQLRAPFGANSYEDSGSGTGRMNLAFAVESPALHKFFEELDAFVQKVAFQNCQSWFKKFLTETEVTGMYRPCLSSNEKNYSPLVRTKINMSQPNQVRVWRARGGRVEEGTPDDVQRSARFMPVVSISGLWYLSRLFGITLTCTDLVVFPDTSRSFPFRTALQMGGGGGARVPDANEDDDLNSEAAHEGS
jgi:hypothetical protein